MSHRRTQLTLFLDDRDSSVLEGIRREFNPDQYALIKSHVTLCREDELQARDLVMQNLRGLAHGPITLEFGGVVRFSEGRGLMIPGFGDNLCFHRLRIAILRSCVDHPRRHEPHITLMHPRNAMCTDAIFEQVRAFPLPRRLEFKTISLIEQYKDQRWEVVEEFELRSVQ